MAELAGAETAGADVAGVAGLSCADADKIIEKQAAANWTKARRNLNGSETDTFISGALPFKTEQAICLFNRRGRCTGRLRAEELFSPGGKRAGVRRLRNVRKDLVMLSEMLEKHPSGAEAPTFFEALSARLKSCPFKTGDP